MSITLRVFARSARDDTPCQRLGAVEIRKERRRRGVGGDDRIRTGE
jgi:hypothetical protein